MRPERFRASCDEILMAEIGPNASGGSENPLGKTETGTRKVTSRPTAPNQSVMATPTCQRRRNLHGFRIKKAFVFSHNEYHRDGRVLTVPSMVMSAEQTRIVEFMHQFAPRFIDASTHCDIDAKCDIIGATLVEEGIVSYSEHRHRLLMAKDESEVAKLVMTDTILKGVLETFCKNGFNQDNYILDFDCDFFRDRGAMAHDRLQLLKNLIKGAKAITIAREPGADECSGHVLSYEEIEDWLFKLIENCIDDVQIEYEP